MSGHDEQMVTSATVALSAALADLLTAYGATVEEIDAAARRVWDAIDREIDRVTD